MSAIWSHSFYLLVFSPLFLLSLFFFTILSDWCAQVINMLRFVLMLDWIRSQILFKVCLTSDNIFNSRTFHSNNFLFMIPKICSNIKCCICWWRLAVWQSQCCDPQLTAWLYNCWWPVNSEKNNVTFVYHVIK